MTKYIHDWYAQQPEEAQAIIDREGDRLITYPTKKRSGKVKLMLGEQSKRELVWALSRWLNEHA